MDAVLILGQNVNLRNYDLAGKYLVGVDSGASFALKQGINLDLAVGDFDSVTPLELVLIKTKVKNVVVLSPIKDDTDTLHALNMVKDYDNILMLGGITGKRIEHFVANYKLLYKFPNLTIADDDCTIKLVSNYCEFSNKNFFYSFFALEYVTDLDLIGFKYPLKKYQLGITDPLCISNEIIGDKGILRYKSGKLALFMTKK